MRAAWLILVLASVARAQIVNVQPMIDREAEGGLHAAASASLDYRSGNVNLTLVTGELLVGFRAGRHLVFGLVHGELGIKDSKHFLDSDLEHLRYRTRIVGPLELEEFLQHSRDGFRRLALRVLVGGGARLRILDGRIGVAALGLSLMADEERLSTGAFADSGLEKLVARLSSYVTVRVHLAERLAITETVYAQPRLDAPSDVRMLEESELRVAATSLLSLKLAVTFAYDSRPPIGVQDLDRRITTSLNLTY